MEIGKPIYVKTPEQKEVLRRILSSNPVPVKSKKNSPNFPSRQRITERYW